MPYCARIVSIAGLASVVFITSCNLNLNNVNSSNRDTSSKNETASNKDSGKQKPSDTPTDMDPDRHLANVKLGSGTNGVETETTVFAPSTPKFYCEMDVSGVSKGSKIVGTWFAVDAQGVDKNFKIDTTELELGGPDKVTFSLERSVPAWPNGTYRLDIALDGKLLRQVRFSVAG